MSNIKIIPIYFPQFHAIEENNKWWGNGFTDWDNVKNAKPLYKGHNQPRIPLNKNYYDLTNIDTIKWQVELAKKYLIYGFTIYHYWFDGKLVLNLPTEKFLNNQELNIPFALTWANEKWTTRWEGTEEKVIIEQTHEPSIEKWEEHFLYLLDFFKDPRYIKINNKPIFAIYRPYLIKQLDKMITYWQKRAKECGLNGIYMIAIKNFEIPNLQILNNFDACMRFQPFETVNSFKMLGKSTYIHKQLRKMPENILDSLRKLNKKIQKTYKTYDYDNVCYNMLNNASEIKNITIFDSLFLEWDNTARYKEKSTIYTGCTPEKFEYWLNKLCQKTLTSNSKENIIFINAWNEWAEGTYLEPDEKNRYAYLEAIKRCIDKYN
jgi:lipopolysaccharide biosynthesis protein